MVNNPIVLYLGASGGIACYKQEFGLSKTSHGLDDAVLDLLPKHLTLLRLLLDMDMLSDKLRLFYMQLQADPLICPQAIFVGYMRHLYESEAGYSTVNFYRFGISKFHFGINGISIGEHPLVSQAVKLCLG